MTTRTALTLIMTMFTLISSMEDRSLAAAAVSGAPAITLEKTVHFTAPDGSDVQVPAGAYRVEQAGDKQLRLLPTTGQPPVDLQATAIPHEESLSSPLAAAVLEEGQDDQVHLVLVLPGGQALDATGSFSGTRTRGTFSPALSPFQLQSAVSQVRVMPLPTPQQTVPPIAMVRVPQASAGSVVAAGNQGTWITWNYLAMQHPEVVAQAFAKVQAGKQSIASLSGFASHAELSEMLKTNWSAEVARLNAASPILKQAGVATRGAPMNPTMALTPAVIASIPVQLPAKNLGTVWAGQLAMTVVSITAATDGYVDARFDLNATNRHFRIVNAISYTGRVVNRNLEVYQTIQGGQYQDVIVNPYNPPAQISKAGFVSIPARQGQRIDFTIAFEPVALGMTAVGDNEAILTITGVPSIDIHAKTAPPNWTKVVPIRAHFAGINFGAILYTDQQHVSTLTGQTVDMSVLVRNAASNPVTGTITAAQLPPGVTLSPSAVPVSINPLATQRFMLHFKVAGTAQAGTVQPVVVQLNYTNQTRPLTLDMSIYEPWVWWDFGGSIVTGVDAAGNKTYADRLIPDIPGNRTNQSGDTGVSSIYAWLKNNGDFWWRISTYNMKFVDAGGSNFEVYQRWNGTTITDRIAVHIGPRTNPQDYENTRNVPWLAQNFLQAVEQGMKFSLIDR
jgi:hypothetical protein